MHDPSSAAVVPPETSPSPVVEARSLEYRVPDRPILRGADLSVGPGETVAIVGPSGSGKTTLLRCLAGIVSPGSGEVWLAGRPLHRLSPSQRAAVRLRAVGFVFQFAELLPELTVRENVQLPLLLQGIPRRASRASADDLLAAVGLRGRGEDSPAQLSGGEAQRVAVARALAHRPSVVLADEPTGALDESTATRVLNLLLRLVEERGTALIVVTHNPRVAAQMAAVYELREGKLHRQR